jgi:hypothetical protein
MTHHPSSIRRLFLAVSLLAAAPAYAGTEAPAASRRISPPAPSPLTTEVERELAAAPADGRAFEIVYRRTVRSDQDAASFFYSAAFLRLGLADQRQVIESALALDPAGFFARSEFLPLSLRAEYRSKARSAAEDLQLRRLAAMSADDQVLLYLPSREGMRGQDGGAFDPKDQLRRFRRDPGLARFAEVELAWVAEAGGPFVSAEAMVEARVIVTRALAARRLEPSREHVALVWSELAAERERLSERRLFAGRHVVLAAGKDDLGTGATFGKESTVAALHRQAPASLAVLRSGQRNAAGELAREIGRPGELTLLLETHGRPGALEFGGALGADELAAMFAARPADSQAIVIFNTCFGHDFARAFAARLQKRGLPMPILIVPEEFGQATLIGRQENDFTRGELGLGRADASSFSGLWPGLRRATAVYAPIAGQLVQLR